MCLFFPGMGMNQEPPFQLTVKAKQMTQTLQIISLIHFTLVLIIMFTVGGGGFGSFTMLITPLILCCATCSYQYFCLMFYIFYAIIDFIGFIEPCGLLIQLALRSNMSASWSMTTYVPLYIMLIFLPIAIRFAFLTYREYKALQFEA